MNYPLLITLITSLLYTTEMLSQIAINTDTPEGIFHIDALQNNSAPLISKYDDDFVVDKDGNVGLGTITPTQKLDIRGNVAINDGSQVVNYIWTAKDNLGNAEWMVRASNRTAQWYLGSTSPVTLSTTETKLTGNSCMILPGDQIGITANTANNSITVPDGKYMIFFWGDIEGPEIGFLSLKNAAGDILIETYFSEFLSGPSAIVEFSSPTELYLSYKHLKSGLIFYNAYDQDTYQASYYIQVSFLRLK